MALARTTRKVQVKIETVESVIATRKITMLIYGQSGVGKTSLIKSLPYAPEELLYVAADPGQLALKPKAAWKVGEPEYLKRDMGKMGFLKPKTMAEFKETLEIIKSAHTKYKMVIIDGLDEVGKDCLRIFKEAEAAKGARANMQAAYGNLADAMEAWIGEIQDAQVSSLFITHIDEDSESDIPYGPAFPGRKMTNSLPDLFDEVLCLRMDKRTVESKPELLLHCNRTVGIRYKVKDRSGCLEPYETPDLKTVLGKIFGQK